MAILAAAILVCMPPDPMTLLGPPAMASMAGVISRTRPMNSASGSSVGLAVYNPSISDSNTKQSAPTICATRAARRWRAPPPQPVAVAIADPRRRHRVVFVDHRLRAERQQGVQGDAGVQIAAALFGVAKGQQYLRHRDFMRIQ